jgi:hypothetical protein
MAQNFPRPRGFDEPPLTEQITLRFSKEFREEVEALLRSTKAYRRKSWFYADLVMFAFPYAKEELEKRKKSPG